MKFVCGPPMRGVTHTRLGVDGSRSAVGRCLRPSKHAEDVDQLLAG